MLALQALGISRRYRRTVAFENISLSAERGAVLGLVGPNGAGKTSLLRALSGLLRVDTGVVLWSGRTRPGRVAYFAGGHTIPGDVRACDWAALCGQPGSTTDRRRLSRLSRGTRQQVGLAAVLGQAGTELLVLDEPWEGLDPAAADWLNDMILAECRRGAAVICSSHRVRDLAGCCQRFLLLAPGTQGVVTVHAPEEQPSERAELVMNTLRRLHRCSQQPSSRSS